MKCMHHTGLANQINSDYRDDGLVLNNAYMTAMLKCVPPQDKPTASELKNCFGYFNREMKLLENLKTIVALGKIAFDGTLKYYKQFDDLKTKDFQFGHGKSYKMPNGMTIGAFTFKSEDDLDVGEEYSANGAEIQYNIASGLKATISVVDYDYKITTANHESADTSADSGTMTQLTIGASF